jgi:hypothetical protein
MMQELTTPRQDHSVDDERLFAQRRLSKYHRRPKNTSRLFAIDRGRDQQALMFRGIELAIGAATMMGASPVIARSSTSARCACAPIAGRCLIRPVRTSYRVAPAWGVSGFLETCGGSPIAHRSFASENENTPVRKVVP